MRPRPELGHALAAFGLKVERAVAYDSGRVSVAFADGSTLTVDPDPDYGALELCFGEVHLGARGKLALVRPRFNHA